MPINILTEFTVTVEKKKKVKLSQYATVTSEK